jgi:hypothetical protein
MDVGTDWDLDDTQRASIQFFPERCAARLTRRRLSESTVLEGGGSFRVAMTVRVEAVTAQARDIL